MAMVTRCKHPDIADEAELPTLALAVFVARGWEPISDSRSEEDARQERVDAENAAALHVAAVMDVIAGSERPTVKAILDEVGDDPAAAAAALAVEAATENPRTTLVARLNQITTPAGDAGTTERN